MDFSWSYKDDDNKEEEEEKEEGYDDEEAELRNTVKCESCKKEYGSRDVGTCHWCYEEDRKTEEELKREIKDLKSKVSFFRFTWGLPLLSQTFFSDVILVVSDDHSTTAQPVPTPAHHAILACHSLVFRAMLGNEK